MPQNGGQATDEELEAAFGAPSNVATDEDLAAAFGGEESKKKTISQPVSTPLENSGTGSVSVRPSTSATEPFDKFSNTVSSAIKGNEVSAMGFDIPKDYSSLDAAKSYEQSQKELIGAQKGVDWATGRDEELKSSLDPELRKSAGKYTQDAAVKLGHAQFKSDENIGKLKEAIKGDLDYVGSNLENFTRKSQEEDVIADEVKIDEYAKEQARKKGLPEDGYYKNFLYNNAKAEVAQKIIEPDVLKEREKLFKEKTGKSIDAAFGEDFAKGFTKAQEIEQTAKTQVNLVAQEVNSLAKVETEEVAKGVNSQIEQLNSAYQQQASQVTDQAQADALHQEYTANFNKLQANFLDAQNQINGKYNQRLRRQADEIEKVASQKWAEEAEKYKKEYKASPELLAQLKDVSQEAYKKVVGGNEKIKEARDYSVPALNNYYRSTVSSLGRSLGNLSETVGYDYGKVLGDYMENTYQPGSAELNSWKDLLDASKLAKSAGQLTGAMLPSMTAAAATTIATEGMGAPAAVSMLAGGLAAWTGESMDMAGNIERETFAETGDANKALERSKRMWDAQIAIMPLYALEGLPFMKGLSISKNVGKRMAGGAVAEYVPEILQEYTQTKAEEVINKDKEFSQIFETASWKEFGHTALNVAPVILLGAGGQIKGEASEKEKSETDAKKFAKTYGLKEEFTELASDQRDQFLSTMLQRKGVNFTSAFISGLYTNGQISKASANELTKSMGIALEVQNKAKEYGLDQAQQQVFTAFKYKLDAAQRRLAEETDPILKQVAEQRVKELEEQTVNFASGKQADYVVLTYPNNEQYVLSLSQAQNAAKNPKLIQSIQSGDMKVDGVGKGVDVVNGIAEGIKAEKKAKVDAEKAGLVAETGAFIEDRIATQNANYAQKTKQDAEANTETAPPLQSEPTAVIEANKDVAGVPDEAIKADTRETKPAPAIQKSLEETEKELDDVSKNKATKKFENDGTIWTHLTNSAEAINNILNTKSFIGRGEKLENFTKEIASKKFDLNKRNGTAPYFQRGKFYGKPTQKYLIVTKGDEKFTANINRANAKDFDASHGIGVLNPDSRDISNFEIYVRNEQDGNYYKYEQKAETPTQDTPTKSDKQQPSKGQAKGSVPTTQEPVRVDAAKEAKKKDLEMRKEREKEAKQKRKDISSAEPNDIRQMILQYFYGGGKIHTDDFKRETAFGTRGGQQDKVRSFKEFKKRIWAHTKSSPSIDDLVMQFQDAFSANFGSVEDQQSIRNEIIGVLKDFDSKSQIEGELERLFSVGDKIVTGRDERNQNQAEEDLMRRYTPDNAEEARQMEAYERMSRGDLELIENDDQLANELSLAFQMTDEEAQKLLDEEEEFNKFVKQENENIKPTSAVSTKVSEERTQKTAGQQKASSEYEAELADITQKLKEAEKAKRDKLDRISGKVDLFADEAKSNELFGAEQNLSAENIAKQLQPETDKIAKLEAEKAAFEANKENYLKKYDNQSEISEEKPLTEKEKAQKEFDDAMAALQRKLGAGSGLQLQALPEFIAVVKAAVKVGYVTAKKFAKDFKDKFPNHTEQEIEDAFNEVNKTEDLEKGMEEGEKKDGGEKEKSERREKRKLAQQFLNSKDISQKFKDAITEDAIYYDRFPNNLSLQDANAFLETYGEEAAMKAVLDLSNGMRFAPRMILGQVLIKKMNAKGYDAEAVEFSEKFFELSTELGQGIQALSLFQFLTPEGQVKAAQKVVKKMRDKQIKGSYKQIKKLKAAVDKANKEAAEEVVKKVAKKIKKVSEIPNINSPKYGEKNKIVTKDEYNKLLKELRGSMFSNVDPRIVKIAAFHIEAGSREFAQFTETMVKTLGKKVKPYLKDLYKQAQDLFEDKEGFTTDEDILKAENEAKGQEIKEKISKALKSGNKKTIEEAIAEISQNGELWGKYKDMAVKRLQQMSMSEIQSDIKQKAVLDEFTQGLIKNIREQAEKKGEGKSVEKKPAIQIIADAYKNFEKYQEVWEQAKKDFAEKNKDNPEKLAELDAYFGDITLKPFSENLVKQSIKEGLEDLDIKIGEIIKAHYTVYEDYKRSLVNKLIDDAGLSPQEANELAKEIEKEFDKLALEKRKQYLDKALNQKQRSKPNVKQLYEKLLEISNVGVLSDNQFNELYAQKMGYATLTPEQANKIKELAEKVQNAPDGHLKFRAIEDLLKYHANLKGVNYWEIPLAWWYASVLSGHQTQQRNIIANVANTVMLYANAAMQSRSPLFLAKAAVLGMKKGWLEAQDVLQTGYSPIRGKIEVPPVLERIKFEGWKYPANAAKYVRRAMVAADVLFFEAQKEMRAYQLALVQARKEGKLDPTLNERNRTLQILNASNGAFEVAIEQAQLEMETKLQEIENSTLSEKEKAKEKKAAEHAMQRRAYDILNELRPTSIKDESATFASKGTYNYTPQGLLGAMAKSLNSFSDKAWFVRLVVPFVNIISNVANDALNYTPYGFARYATLKKVGENEYEGGSLSGKLSSKEFNENITEQERADMLYKAAMGVAFTAAFLMLSAPDDEEEPVIEVTANGTGDWRKNLELRETGWQPYSVRFKKPSGGYTDWVSYQYSPLILALGWVGNIRDFEKYRDVKIDDSFISKYGAATSYTMRSIFDMSFLNSADKMLSGIFDIRNENKAEDAYQALQKSAKAFVVPNAYTQSAKMMQDYFDMGQKETRGTWLGYTLRDIPVARGMYKDQINVLGEPVQPDSDVLFSGSEASKELQLLVDKNVFISQPNPLKDTYLDEKDGWKEKEFQTNPEKFYQYAKERGTIIKDFVSENYDYLRTLPKKDVKRIMTHVQQEATNYAKINTQGYDIKPDFNEYMEKQKGNIEEVVIELTPYEEWLKGQNTSAKKSILKSKLEEGSIDEDGLEQLIENGVITKDIYKQIAE